MHRWVYAAWVSHNDNREVKEQGSCSIWCEWANRREEPDGDEAPRRLTNKDRLCPEALCCVYSFRTAASTPNRLPIKRWVNAAEPARSSRVSRSVELIFLITSGCTGLKEVPWHWWGKWQTRSDTKRALTKRLITLLHCGLFHLPLCLALSARVSSLIADQTENALPCYGYAGTRVILRAATCLDKHRIPPLLCPLYAASLDIWLCRGQLFSETFNVSLFLLLLALLYMHNSDSDTLSSPSAADAWPCSVAVGVFVLLPCHSQYKQLVASHRAFSLLANWKEVFFLWSES